MSAAAWRAWSRRHGYSLLSSIGALVRAPWTSSLTIVVLAIALSLPLGLYTALDNLRAVHAGLDRLDSISAFMALDTDAEAARRAASRLGMRPDIMAVDPIAPEQGLAELAGTTGLEAVELGEVPLPWVLQVVPAPEADPARVAEALRGLAGIDMVVVDLDWVRRLDAILDVFARLVELLAVLFGLSVLFVISNNVRTEIERRREEIEVMAMVGATPGYIRRPFLYSGAWMGAGGALLAWMIVQAGLWLLDAPVERLMASYEAAAGLAGPPLPLLGVMLLATVALGIAGAWIAVGRELARVNP